MDNKRLLSQDTILIKRGTIIDPQSDFNRKQADIFIKNGVIETISGSALSKRADVEIDAQNCYVYPGMMDLRCQLKDPGFEHQEDIQSGSEAAAFSGFTALAAHPTTDPVTQNKSQIEYILKSASTCLPSVYPVGATTENMEAHDITEMYDMRRAGAVGFSNGDSSYSSSGALMRALMYSKEFGGLVMSHAIDADIANGASVNESVTTIHTGLKQQPDLAETGQIKKEIDIAAYADASIHFSHVSSAKTIDIIREARKEGKKVTCDVSIWHLVYTDKSVLEYDTNFKVNPPFRTEEDRKALIAGLVDGTIDAIVSDHNPQNIENKLVEFDYASYGINGLQTFYSVYNQFLSEEIPVEVFLEKTVYAPRNLLNLKPVSISTGSTANLWVADPTAEWVLNKSSNLSKSENNPLFGQTLKGKCKFVINDQTFRTF